MKIHGRQNPSVLFLSIQFIAFHMSSMRGQQHWFFIHQRMFVRYCRRFRDRKCLDPRGIWTRTLDSYRMLHYFSYVDHIFAIPCFRILALVVIYLVVKSTFGTRINEHSSAVPCPYSGPFFGTTWWRQQMKTFSALLALCAGNSPVTGEFPSQRSVTRRFNIFFDLRLINRLSKQSWGWWFETPSCSSWRHRNDFSCYWSALSQYRYTS